MAESGRSLKPFYLVLVAIAVIGIVLIVRAGGQNPAAGLTTAACNGAPLGGPAPQGVSLGPDSAPVHITEYSDFVCPFCGRFAILTMPDVRSRLIPTGKVRWTFMDFPLDQHPNSSAAHLAAGCAFAQNRFWPMFDSLFMNQNQWAEEGNPTRRFLGYASGIGLNVDSFRVCLRERRPWPRIEANKCEGERLGVDGTPTFFVNGRKLPEPVLAYDDIRRIVDSVTALRPAGAVPVATGRR